MARVLRILVCVVFAAPAYWTVKLAVADHLSRSPDRYSRLRATQLAPSATHFERLAERIEEAGEDPLPALQRALDLDPQNPERYLRVGLQAELRDNLALAERNLIRAAGISRLYAPRYALAQYYFRRRNADSFWRWTHEAYAASYGDVTPLLDLCRRMQPDPRLLAQQSLREKPAVVRQYLAMLTAEGELEAAHSLAHPMAANAVVEDVPALLGYCNLGLSRGLAQPAVEVWNTLCRRRLLPYEPLDVEHGPWITNPAFRSVPLGSAFDWTLVHAPWLRTERSGGELRLSLSGTQPENSLVAWQYIPAVPGRSYQLRATLRGLDTPDPNGFAWILFDPAGSWSAGEPRTDGTVIFHAPAEVMRLALMYRRPPGSARFEGTVTVGAITLELVR